MIRMDEEEDYYPELAGGAAFAASGGLALSVKQRGAHCPFRKWVLVASGFGVVGSSIYLARRIYIRLMEREARRQTEEEEERLRQARQRPFHPHDLMRKNVLELEPYRCARDDYSEGTLLDANENSFGSTLPEELQSLGLERYPDPYQLDLKEKIAKFR